MTTIIKRKTFIIFIIAALLIAFAFPIINTSYAASSAKTAKGKVKVSYAVLRKSASKSSKRLATIKKNKTVTIYKEVFTTAKKTGASKKWYYVKYKGKMGFLRSDLVKVTSYKTVKAWTTDGLNYRAGAGVGMKKKGSINKDKQVNLVLAASGKGVPANWYKVKIKSKYYYVCADWITFTEPAPAPTVQPSPEALKVIDDACAWAVNIANDNSFHYGACNQHSGSPKAKANTSHSFCAHHEGCYYCGTNAKRKSKWMVSRDKTYCCNTFVTAAFAHGGNDPVMLKRCQSANSLWVTDYPKVKYFASLGHPDQSALQKGDVLCASSHVALYLGNGQIAEAGSRDDNVSGSSAWNNSIRVTPLSASRYSGFKKVYRYIGH